SEFCDEWIASERQRRSTHHQHRAGESARNPVCLEVELLMNKRTIPALVCLLCSVMCLLWSAPSFVAQRSSDIDLLINLEPFDKLINVANIDLRFDTYHPQGIVKIGDEFFLTATDSRMAGYMIKFSVRSSAATMIQQTRLADPSFPNRIHPGGIDYDSSRNRIWCPLAERLPNTSTSILMVNPDNLAYENVGSILDHLGTTIVDAEDNRVR